MTYGVIGYDAHQVIQPGKREKGETRKQNETYNKQHSAALEP